MLSAPVVNVEVGLANFEPDTGQNLVDLEHSDSGTALVLSHWQFSPNIVVVCLKMWSSESFLTTWMHNKKSHRPNHCSHYPPLVAQPE